MILVNNIPLDISKETPVSFNIDWMDIRKVGDVTVQGVVSIGIDLPSSNRNIQALGHYSPVTERSNVIPYQYAPNGNIIIEGMLRIEGRSKDVIKIRLTAGSSDWIDQVKTIDTKDVDMGVRRFNQADYLAALEDQTDVMYPFFRFFADQFTSTTIHVNNFKPAPNAGTFIKRFFQLVNYKANFIGRMKVLDKIHTLRGNPSDAKINQEDSKTLLNTDAGNNLFEWGLGNLANTTAMIPLPAASITENPGGNTVLVPFTHQNQPPPDPILITSNYPYYTSSAGANYSVTVKLRFRCQGGSPAQFNNETKPILAQVVQDLYTNTTTYTVLNEKVIHYTGHIGQANNPSGNVFVDTTVRFDDFVIAEGVGFFIQLRLPNDVWTNTVKFAATLVDIQIDTARTLVVDGLFYNVSNSLPSMKGADLIRSMVQNFNGIVETKGFNVNFYNRDEWYLDTFDDWTNKVDHLQPVTHTPISDISKRLLYDYLEDNDDFNLERYMIAQDKNYGSKVVRLTDPLLSGEQKATGQIQFAPSYPETGIGVNLATGYRQGEVADGFANNYNIKDRILLNKGKRGLQYILGGAAGNINATAYIQGDFEDLKFENLIPIYFQKTLDFLNRGEFVECSVRLTPNDYQSLDYRKAKLIRLSDGNIAKAWINKISDLRPHMNTATTIEFIILKNRGEADRNVPRSGAYDNGYNNGYE